MNVSAPDFDFVRELVRANSAIVLEPGKEYLVETRLEPLARSEGFATLGSLVAALRTGRAAELQRKVVDRMTTNETSFFRDLHPFDSLKKSILPELIARRAGERALRMWSAACSSGQEPYGMMMVLREHFPVCADWRIQLLATDLNGAMVARARAGIYTQLEVNRGLPATMLVKYFEKRGPEWHVREHLRRGMEFREMNLARSWPALPRMDIIFLRNVMIYFDVPAKRALLAQLRNVLRPDGCVIFGAAETTYGLDEGYERVVYGKTAAYQVKA